MEKTPVFKVGQLVELRSGARLYVMSAKLWDEGRDVIYRMAPELDDPEEHWLGEYTVHTDGIHAPAGKE